MLKYLNHCKYIASYRFTAFLIIVCFISNLIIWPQDTFAQNAVIAPITGLNLPAPGIMVTPSAGFNPPIILGMTVHPENPFLFDFIIHPGDERLQGETLKKESTRLIKYFLASLTIPENEMWVNLSPYEKDRVIPNEFGKTEMGRDLLAQDYILKQLTASLMYPEKELGKAFWEKVYKQAQDKFGSSDIPLDTFNKVWIMPETADIYENDASVFVVNSHLKVLLDQDYLTMNRSLSQSEANGIVSEKSASEGKSEKVALQTQIIKDIILPEIEREVNEGKNFSNLRQIYNSLILAVWYKENLKESILSQKYVDQQKTPGVETDDKAVNQKIYQQYLEAFKKGVYNYIKEDYDPVKQEVVNRKYFSGGITNLEIRKKLRRVAGAGTVMPGKVAEASNVTAQLNPDNAMAADGKDNDRDFKFEDLKPGMKVRYKNKVHLIDTVEIKTIEGEQYKVVILNDGTYLGERGIKELKILDDRGLPDSVLEKGNVRTLADRVQFVKDWLKKAEGEVSLERLIQEINYDIASYRISSSFGVWVFDENRRRFRDDPERNLLTQPKVKDKFFILQKLRSFQGTVSVYQFAYEVGLTVKELINNVNIQQLIWDENERRSRIKSNLQDIKLSFEKNKSEIIEILKKVIMKINRMDRSVFLGRFGLERADLSAADFIKAMNEENKRRKEKAPEATTFRVKGFVMDEIVAVTLSYLEGDISVQILSEEITYSTNVIGKTNYKRLVYNEWKTRQKNQDTRPFNPVDVDLSVMKDEADAKLNKASEARNEVKIKGEIDEFFKNFDEDSILFLAARYGMSIKNIIWGVVSFQLEGKYDRSKLEKLIDEHILDAIEKTTTKERSLTQLKPIGVQKSTQAPALYIPESMTQEKIVQIASYLEDKIKRIETKDSEAAALLEMARQQAVRFIRNLEEQYFFKKYYSSAPELFDDQDIQKTITDIREREKGGVIGQALGEILENVENAVKGQEFLYQNGLNRKTKLNLYQLIAVNQMMQNKRMLLADEMGLGKTLETIATFLISMKKEMLVLAPKKALSRWLEDILNHTDEDIEIVNLTSLEIPESFESNPRVKVITLKGDEKKQYLYKDRAPPAKGRRVILGNFESLPSIDRYRRDNKLDQMKVDFIAIDEAHLLKKRSTLISRAVFGDKNGNDAIQADFRVVITGTPLENRVQDLFGYLQYLALGGESAEERFLSTIDIENFERLFKRTDLDHLNLLHTYLAAHMIRRLKEDVVKGLPKKVFKTARLNPINGTMELNGDAPVLLEGNFDPQLSLYEMALRFPDQFEQEYGLKSKRALQDDVDEEVEDIESTAKTQILRLEQAATDPQAFGEEIDNIKFQAIVKLLEERLSQGKSVLIFTDYKTASKHLSELLIKKFGEQIVHIDGDVNTQDRFARADEFQEGKAQVMVATVGTMGTSVQLTQADCVVLLNNPWKPSTLNQAIDRAHRIDEKRNYAGKELEIITLELDLPISIDALKAKVIKQKEILGEMIVNGNMSPEILEVFKNMETSFIMSAIEEAYESPMVAFDQYEQSLMEQFYERLQQALHERNADRAEELWNEISGIYIQILQHKSSYFANIANLVYLSRGTIEGLVRDKIHPLVTLDLASGPSTLYRAYQRQKSEFESNGLFLDITDYDFSPMMLERGVARGDKQILGSFEVLGQLPPASYDVINLAYAYRYAEHPAQLIMNIQRILKVGGLFVLLLPKTNIIPDRFYQKIQEAGFEIKTEKGKQLESKIDDETYQELVQQYGQEFADDIANQVYGQFTYFVVKKERDSAVELQDEDFRMNWQGVKVNRDKVKRLQKTTGVRAFVPEDVRVDAEITEGSVLDEGQQTPKFKINRDKLIGRINKRLAVITRYISSFENTNVVGKREIAKRTKLEREIIRDLNELRQYIAENADQINLQSKVQLTAVLNNFESRKLIRQWFSQEHGGLSMRGFISELISLFEGEQAVVSFKEQVQALASKVNELSSQEILTMESAYALIDEFSPEAAHDVNGIGALVVMLANNGQESAAGELNALIGGQAGAGNAMKNQLGRAIGKDGAMLAHQKRIPATGREGLGKRALAGVERLLTDTNEVEEVFESYREAFLLIDELRESLKMFENVEDEWLLEAPRPQDFPSDSELEDMSLNQLRQEFYKTQQRDRHVQNAANAIAYKIQATGRKIRYEKDIEQIKRSINLQISQNLPLLTIQFSRGKTYHKIMSQIRGIYLNKLFKQEGVDSIEDYLRKLRELRSELGINERGEEVDDSMPPPTLLFGDRRNYAKMKKEYERLENIIKLDADLFQVERPHWASKSYASKKDLWGMSEPATLFLIIQTSQELMLQSIYSLDARLYAESSSLNLNETDEVYQLLARINPQLPKHVINFRIHQNLVLIGGKDWEDKAWIKKMGGELIMNILDIFSALKQEELVEVMADPRLNDILSYEFLALNYDSEIFSENNFKLLKNFPPVQSPMYAAALILLTCTHLSGQEKVNDILLNFHRKLSQIQDSIIPGFQEGINYIYRTENFMNDSQASNMAQDWFFKMASFFALHEDPIYQKIGILALGRIYNLKLTVGENITQENKQKLFENTKALCKSTAVIPSALVFLLTRLGEDGLRLLLEMESTGKTSFDANAFAPEEYIPLLNDIEKGVDEFQDIYIQIAGSIYKRAPPILPESLSIKYQIYSIISKYDNDFIKSMRGIIGRYKDDLETLKRIESQLSWAQAVNRELKPFSFSEGSRIAPTILVKIIEDNIDINYSGSIRQVIRNWFFDPKARNFLNEPKAFFQFLIQEAKDGRPLTESEARFVHDKYSSEPKNKTDNSQTFPDLTPEQLQDFHQKFLRFIQADPYQSAPEEVFKLLLDLPFIISSIFEKSLYADTPEALAKYFNISLKLARFSKKDKIINLYNKTWRDRMNDIALHMNREVTRHPKERRMGEDEKNSLMQYLLDLDEKELSRAHELFNQYFIHDSNNYVLEIGKLTRLLSNISLSDLKRIIRAVQEDPKDSLEELLTSLKKTIQQTVNDPVKAEFLKEEAIWILSNFFIIDAKLKQLEPLLKELERTGHSSQDLILILEEIDAAKTINQCLAIAEKYKVSPLYLVRLKIESIYTASRENKSIQSKEEFLIQGVLQVEKLSENIAESVSKELVRQISLLPESNQRRIYWAVLSRTVTNNDELSAFILDAAWPSSIDATSFKAQYLLGSARQEFVTDEREENRPLRQFMGKARSLTKANKNGAYDLLRSLYVKGQPNQQQLSVFQSSDQELIRSLANDAEALIRQIEPLPPQGKIPHVYFEPLLKIKADQSSYETIRQLIAAIDANPRMRGATARLKNDLYESLVLYTGTLHLTGVESPKINIIFDNILKSIVSRRGVPSIDNVGEFYSDVRKYIDQFIKALDTNHKAMMDDYSDITLNSKLMELALPVIKDITKGTINDIALKTLMDTLSGLQVFQLMASFKGKLNIPNEQEVTEKLKQYAESPRFKNWKDNQGRNIFDLIAYYLKPIDDVEVYQNILDALMAEADGRFREWRYESADYKQTLDAIIDLTAAQLPAEKQLEFERAMQKLKGKWKIDRLEQLNGFEEIKSRLAKIRQWEKTFVREMDDELHGEMTDDFYALFNIGNYAGSTACQSCTYGSPLNRGLTGYVVNGANKALTLMDEFGRVAQTRRIVRLRIIEHKDPVTQKDVKEPVIFVEESTQFGSRYINELYQILRRVSQETDLPVVGGRSKSASATEIQKGTSINVKIYLFKGRSAFDYSDYYGSGVQGQITAGLYKQTDDITSTPELNMTIQPVEKDGAYENVKIVNEEKRGSEEFPTSNKTPKADEALIGSVQNENVKTNDRDVSSKDPLGGIDLNPSSLKLNRQGQRSRFNLNVDSNQWQNIQIDGLIPVIINIVPVTNMPLLLGLKEIKNLPGDISPSLSGSIKEESKAEVRQPEILGFLN